MRIGLALLRLAIMSLAIGAAVVNASFWSFTSAVCHLARRRRRAAPEQPSSDGVDPAPRGLPPEGDLKPGG